MQSTLTIIKPDSVAAGNSGKILAHLETAGFELHRLVKLHLSEAQARSFYEVHKERPFYNDLVAFMTEGPIIAVALKRDDAVNGFPLVVVVDDSEFVSRSLDNFLWTTFTRSNPATDVYGIESFVAAKHFGCHGSLVIDARIKPHHAPPLAEDPQVTRRVDAFDLPPRVGHVESTVVFRVVQAVGRAGELSARRQFQLCSRFPRALQQGYAGCLPADAGDQSLDVSAVSHVGPMNRAA